jgi:hypothetical protein
VLDLVASCSRSEFLWRSAMQQVCGRVALGLVGVLAAQIAWAGDCGGYSASAAGCAAPYTTTGGSYSAQPYYTGQAASGYGVPYSGFQPWSYGYTAAPPMYTAPYAVAPVQFAFNQPSAPSGCSGAFAAESYAASETLSLVKSIIEIIVPLLPDRGSPARDESDTVSHECREYEERLRHIEEHLKKSGDFTPRSSGKNDPTAPPGARGAAFSDPGGRAAAPPPGGDPLQEISDRLRSIDDKISRIDGFLKEEFPDKYRE